MIKVVDLYKSFGSLEVLRGINNEIHKGEVVCIIGPAVPARALSALPQPAGGAYRGEVFIDGVSLTEHRTISISCARRRNGVSAVQSFSYDRDGKHNPGSHKA